VNKEALTHWGLGCRAKANIEQGLLLKVGETCHFYVSPWGVGVGVGVGVEEHKSKNKKLISVVKKNLLNNFRESDLALIG
jgi:hypothetical protein